ncbi:MAG: 5-(carboxyamino)imidazole ribonucleotide mutase [Dehalococcoidia bacterium]|nr:5-(carboxyamino)imidazole ribonucleotide mutase [Dehalococcoidia bacterium]
MALVSVVMGSKTDEPLMQPALKMLEQLGISYEVSVMSAHRTPAKVKEYASKAREKGIEVIIAGAGWAAHLPGVIASWTDLPVIGVPLATSELKGVDALFSIVQMPSGVPVGSVGIGNSKNAALLAARILSIKHPSIAKAYEEYRKELEAG